VTRLEFLVGSNCPKRPPLAMVTLRLLHLMAVTLFAVTPQRQCYGAQASGALDLCDLRHRAGAVISTLVRTQIAALFGTAVLNDLAGNSFCGLLDPVASFAGAGAVIGAILPHQPDPDHLHRTYLRDWASAICLPPLPPHCCWLVAGLLWVVRSFAQETRRP